jgi:hypothetical protein
MQKVEGSWGFNPLNRVRKSKAFRLGHLSLFLKIGEPQLYSKPSLQSRLKLACNAFT